MHNYKLMFAYTYLIFSTVAEPNILGTSFHISSLTIHIGIGIKMNPNLFLQQNEEYNRAFCITFQPSHAGPSEYLVAL